ncbi:hypothetical protein D9M70_492580 [compost metagenome]
MTIFRLTDRESARLASIVINPVVELHNRHTSTTAHPKQAGVRKSPQMEYCSDRAHRHAAHGVEVGFCRLEIGSECSRGNVIFELLRFYITAAIFTLLSALRPTEAISGGPAGRTE